MVEMCFHSSVLMILQDWPIKGSWRDGGRGEDRCHSGPCVLPDTPALSGQTFCPRVLPRDHSDGRKPAGGCRSELAGSRRVFLEL